MFLFCVCLSLPFRAVKCFNVLKGVFSREFDVFSALGIKNKNIDSFLNNQKKTLLWTLKQCVIFSYKYL